jgi:hypothetical protein
LHPASYTTIGKPIQDTPWDSVIEINNCNGTEESIMDCSHKGFGVTEPDCKRTFVDCDTRILPLPFIATCNIGQMRFGIAGLKLTARGCFDFCTLYGGNTSVIDEEEKYETVYKMTQKTNAEQSVRGNYVIGLEQSKLISEMFMASYRLAACTEKSSILRVEKKMAHL